MGVLLNKATEAGGKTAHTITDPTSGHEVQVVDLYHNPAHKGYVSRFLDANGDGTGNKNWIGDYSTPDLAYIQPAAGETMHLTRMIVTIQDDSALAADGYGGLAGLTNGVTVILRDDSGVIANLTNGDPIKSNAEWGSRCYDITPHSWGGGGSENIVLVRWTFERAGVDLQLIGDDGGRLEVGFSDDFTGLAAHRFCVQGYME